MTENGYAYSAQDFLKRRNRWLRLPSGPEYHAFCTQLEMLRSKIYSVHDSEATMKADAKSFLSSSFPQYEAIIETDKIDLTLREKGRDKIWCSSSSRARIAKGR